MKNKFTEIDSVIFDLDGTLWNSTKVVTRAWDIVLKEHGDVRETIAEEALEGCMGLVIADVGKKLFPYLKEERRIELVKLCCREENEILRKEGGILYPDLETVLQKLSQKYPLFIVSNCQGGYIEAFLEAHRMEKYFKDIECEGNTGLSKAENIKKIIERNNLMNAVYVGDTEGDCKAARAAGIPFVFAEYGFGKVDSYDAAIRKFSDLLSIASLS